MPPSADRNLRASLTSARAHPLILPLYLPALLLSIAQGLIVPVLPLFANSFDAPYIWIGLVLAGDGLGTLLGDLPAGVVVRRLDQRRAMRFGIVLIGLATMALFWARSIPEAFLFRVLSGLGMSLYNVSRHAYISDNITVATRGRSVALLGGTFRMGRMIGPAVAGTVAASSGLRVPFLMYAAVCAAAVLALVIFNRGAAAVPAVSAPARPITLRSIRSTLREQSRLLLWPGTGHFLMQMVRAGPGVLIPLYGSLVIGLGVEQIGWVMAAASAVDMTLFYPTGIIMDRIGRKWAIVPSALVMAAGLALIPFTHTLLGLGLAAALNGFGNGLGSGVMLTIGADLAPREARGEFLGAWSLIGDAGITGGPLVVGAVTDLLALQPAAWVMAGSGLAAALVFGLFVPETLKNKDR